jgi:hypothetical protein
MKVRVYDIEVFPNFFCVCFEDYFSDETWYFEISPWKDDRLELIQFVKKTWLIGYNSQDYDNVVLNYIIKGKRTNSEIYDISQSAISDGYQAIRRYKYNNDYVTVDIMRMLFSKALRVSLKELQVNIDWPRVQDLPKHFTEEVLLCEVEDIKDYCFNDVGSTKAVAKKFGSNIDLRIKIQKEFGIKCLSKDDVNTGVDLFAMFYARDTEDESFKDRRSYRPTINLGDCISDKVTFNSKPFSELLTTLKNKTISKTKGALDYSVIYGGVKHVYGTGGIHSKDRPGVYKPADDEIYMDADVGSLYPSLLILLEACPEHLDANTFIPRYKWLRDTRIKAKKEGDKLIADTYKLSLNGTYGNLISEYSWLYDPKQAMTITLNGQLFLSMLSEQLIDAGFKVDSLNTDGITTFIKKSRLEEYYEICKKWEEYTGLELEYQEYKKVVRRDVNTYFAQFDNGYLKEKGDFLTEVKPGKGYDKPVIQKALKAYFFNDTPIREFIENHDNIYDFCMMQKMGKSKNGNQYRKHVLSGSGVIVFNDYVEKSMKEYKLNYDYYVREAEKIRKLIEPAQLTLF